MDPRIKQYRDHAEQIRHLADAATIPHLRDQMLDVADEFDELADSLDRTDITEVISSLN